jgi:hypothetical protein
VSKTYKGFYKVKNKHKYKGDPENVIYRSSWELRVLNWLDNNPNIIWFASEELHVPYVSPVDQKVHRYFPDFIVRAKMKDGKEITYMLEVKPESQTVMPKKRKKTQKYINEAVTYAINQEKWRAADLFCKEHGWHFKLITERDLGI